MVVVEGVGARGSQSSLREANAASIVEAVRIYGQITQVELAAATGLSPATVSNLVKSLQAAGVVETSATVRSARCGRRYCSWWAATTSPRCA